MDMQKRFPDIVNAISSYKLTQGVRTEQHWKSLKQLNNARPHHTCTFEEKDEIGEFCVSQGLPKRIVKDLKEFQTLFNESPSNVISSLWNNIYYLLLTTLNYTDGERPVSKGLVDHGIVPVLIFFIKKIDLRGKSDDSRETYIVKLCVEMMVNMSRVVPPQALNNTGVVDALIPFVKSPNKSMAVPALVALAAIVDEDQNDLLMANPEPIKLIIDLLKTALCSEDHRLVGGTQWSAYELGDGLSQIAVNDKNKIEIVRQGGLKVLSEFLMKAKDTVEEASAAKCLWMLAFNEDNVKKIKEFPDCIEKLRALKASADSQVSSSASGALWEIEEKAKRGEDIEASRASLKRTDTGDDNMPHIMISYQWEVQNTMIQVKNLLQQNGFKVWMDVEQMQGSLSQAMAEAVENSALVLVCVSSKYEKSANCTSEAKYARNLKKNIIPLMVEKNFKARGWLGLLISDYIWYDFTETSRFQETADKLMKELKTRVPKAIVGAKPIPATEEPSLSAPESLFSTNAVNKWQEKDVISWVKEIGLSQRVRVEAFNHFNGDLLIELWKLKQECPTVYYSALERDLAMAGLMDILKFNRALSACITN